jgi:hypothetical protein
MGVWRAGSKGFERIFIAAANGVKQGKWSAEATGLVRALNGRLVSRIQHGCQDDLDSPTNRGVKPDDHFAAFRSGGAEHLPSPLACKQYYGLHRLQWPYDQAGRYVCSKTT